MKNNRAFLRHVVHLLAPLETGVWVFGGWAEELRGAPSRLHKDIDLLYPAPDFIALDQLMTEMQGVTEIRAKRFPHKRAFELDGVMVELFLIQTDDAGLFTMFWGETRFDWPIGTLNDELIDGFLVASAEALAAYRAEHYRIALSAQ